MKIAVVVETFPKWSERFIAREVRALARAGCEATVFALKRGRLPLGEDPDWRGLLDRTAFCPSPARALSSSSRNLDLAAARPLRKGAAGFSVAEARRFEERLALWTKEREVTGKTAAGLSKLGNIKMKARKAQAAWLAHRLRSGGFDRLIAHFAGLPSTLAWAAAGASGTPFFLAVHARDLFVEPQLPAEKMRAARAVVACHRRALEQLCKIPGGRKKAVLIPHGLPLENFPLRRPAFLAEAKDENTAAGTKRPLLLAAGRFVTKKGYLDLTAALSQPALRELPWWAVFFGEGPERQRLQKEIARRGLGKRITLRQPAAGPELWEAMRRARAFLAPYKTAPDGDRDGVPNIILEAMALGVPVVAATGAGPAEIVGERAAFTAPPGNVPAFAAALLSCLQNRQEAYKRAKHARELVRRTRDLRHTAAAWLSLLKKP